MNRNPIFCCCLFSSNHSQDSGAFPGQWRSRSLCHRGGRTAPSLGDNKFFSCLFSFQTGFFKLPSNFPAASTLMEPWELRRREKGAGITHRKFLWTILEHPQFFMFNPSAQPSLPHLQNCSEPTQGVPAMPESGTQWAGDARDAPSSCFSCHWTQPITRVTSRGWEERPVH